MEKTTLKREIKLNFTLLYSTISKMRVGDQKIYNNKKKLFFIKTYHTKRLKLREVEVANNFRACKGV